MTTALRHLRPCWASMHRSLQTYSGELQECLAQEGMHVCSQSQTILRKLCLFCNPCWASYHLALQLSLTAEIHFTILFDLKSWRLPGILQFCTKNMAPTLPLLKIKLAPCLWALNQACTAARTNFLQQTQACSAGAQLRRCAS